MRDREAVLRFIETFASNLIDGGIPRMPARVFAALLATDSGRMTAAELAERLAVSPAAISGAVRYLAQVDLVVREREPGSRRDVYAVRDNAWFEASIRREGMLARWERSLIEGVQALGPDTPAGRRLVESVAFIQFLEKETPLMLERWREHRRVLIADSSGTLGAGDT